MLSEELPIRVAPQLGGLSIMVSTCASVLLVTVMMRWSPGFTCRVGSSRPSGVMKHRSSVPSVANRRWYENLTFRTPFELNSAGGLWAMLPALNRGQGLATGGTGVAELLVVTVVWAKAHACESASTVRPNQRLTFTCRSPLVSMDAPPELTC